MSASETPACLCPKCGTDLQAQGGVCPRCALGDALAGSADEQGADFLSLHDIPQPGKSVSYIGDYELIDVIARGGMGVVYRARQRSLNRVVALKTLLGGVHASDGFKRRFRQEAEAAAKLQHPNIVPIYEVGEHEGHQYFSMKLVEGGSLAKQMADGKWKINASNRREQQRAIARLMATVAEAVHHAHQRGVLHRDLKPSNILLDEDGQPHVADFGLARLTEQDSDLTQSGVVMGTPNYMAPEQAAGKTREISTAADTYSLGAILYELLADGRPFHADGTIETLRMVIDEDPRPPGKSNPLIDRDIETICLKCLEKNARARYASAGELAEDCHRWLGGEPVMARPSTRVERAIKWARRKPGLAASVIISIFLFVVGCISVLWQWHRAEVANSNVRRALKDAKARVAEAEIQDSSPMEGLSLLARIVRDHPSDATAVNRLLSALEHRSYARPLAKAVFPEQLIWSSDISPDEQTLVTAAYTKSADLWRLLPSPSLIHQFQHASDVEKVHFSLDGSKLLTTTTAHQWHLWNVNDRVHLRESAPQRDRIVGVRFNPEGSQFLTVNSNGVLVLWGTDDGHQRQELLSASESAPFSDAYITELRIHDWPLATFSPNGKRVAGGAGTRKARIWNANNGELELELPHDETIRMIEFSKAGDHLLTVTQGKQAIVWNALTGARLGSPSWLPVKPLESCFSPDGQIVATPCYNGSVYLWSAATGSPIGVPLRHEQYVHKASFDIHGRRLLTCSHDGTARIWEVSTGRAVTAPIPASATLRGVGFLDQGRHFYTRGVGFQLWQVDEEVTASRTLPIHNQVRFAKLVENNQLLLTLDNSKQARLLTIATGEIIPLPSDTGKRFVLPSITSWGVGRHSSELAELLYWEHTAGRNAREFLDDGENISGFASDQSGRRIVLGLAKGGAMVMDFHTPSVSVKRLVTTSRIVSISMSPDGAHFLAGGLDGTVRLWSATNARAMSGEMNHPPESIAMVRLSPDAKWCVTGGNFKGAYLWDLSKSPPASNVLAHGSEITSARFDARSKRVVTASSDRTANIWDMSTARPLTMPLRHQSPVNDAVFCDDTRIVTICLDGTARIWDASSGLPVTEPLQHPDRLNSLDVSNDGKSFVCCADNGSCYLWSIPATSVLQPPDWLCELAEALAGRRFDSEGVPELLSNQTLASAIEHIQKLPANDFYTKWARRRFFAKDRID